MILQYLFICSKATTVTDQKAFQVLRFSFSFDRSTELINMLVDIASACLYHSVIHVSQLRNTVSTSQRDK